MNITFTIDHHKSQQLLLFTADIMFINLLVNKLYLNFKINLNDIKLKRHTHTSDKIFTLLKVQQM